MVSAATLDTEWAAVGARVPRPTAEDLVLLAGELGVTPDALAGEILDAGVRRYRAGHDGQVTPEMIRSADEALAKDDLIDHEQVEERMRGWLARLPA